MDIVECHLQTSKNSIQMTWDEIDIQVDQQIKCLIQNHYFEPNSEKHCKMFYDAKFSMRLKIESNFWIQPKFTLQKIRTVRENTKHATWKSGLSWVISIHLVRGAFLKEIAYWCNELRSNEQKH